MDTLEKRNGRNDRDVLQLPRLVGVGVGVSMLSHVVKDLQWVVHRPHRSREVHTVQVESPGS